MPARQVVVKIVLFATLFIGWASIAGAWTFNAETYEYIGRGQLRGTVPGATYYAKAGVVTNDSGATAEMSVDLYYGEFIGFWQWSPDHGERWVNIDPSVTTWTRPVESGDTVSLRVLLTDANNLVFHILSTSPYGVADEDLGDAYYFAFSPNAYYYSDFSTREVGINGYVAVIKDLP